MADTSRLLQTHSNKRYQPPSFLYFLHKDSWLKCWCELTGCLLTLYPVPNPSQSYYPSPIPAKISSLELNPPHPTTAPLPAINLFHAAISSLITHNQTPPPLPYNAFFHLTINNATFSFAARSAINADSWLSAIRLSIIELSKIHNLHTLYLLDQPIHQPCWQKFALTPFFHNQSVIPNIYHQGPLSIKHANTQEWKSYWVLISSHPLGSPLQQQSTDTTNRNSMLLPASKFFNKKKKSHEDLSVSKQSLQNNTKSDNCGHIFIFESQKDVKRNRIHLHNAELEDIYALFSNKDAFIGKLRGEFSFPNNPVEDDSNKRTTRLFSSTASLKSNPQPNSTLDYILFKCDSQAVLLEWIVAIHAAFGDPMKIETVLQEFEESFADGCVGVIKVDDGKDDISESESSLDDESSDGGSDSSVTSSEQENIIDGISDTSSLLPIELKNATLDQVGIKFTDASSVVTTMGEPKPTDNAISPNNKNENKDGDIIVDEITKLKITSGGEKSSDKPNNNEKRDDDKPNNNEKKDDEDQREIPNAALVSTGSNDHQKPMENANKKPSPSSTTITSTNPAWGLLFLSTTDIHTPMLSKAIFNEILANKTQAYKSSQLTQWNINHAQAEAGRTLFEKQEIEEKVCALIAWINQLQKNAIMGQGPAFKHEPGEMYVPVIDGFGNMEWRLEWVDTEDFEKRVEEMRRFGAGVVPLKIDSVPQVDDVSVVKENNESSGSDGTESDDDDQGKEPKPSVGDDKDEESDDSDSSVNLYHPNTLLGNVPTKTIRPDGPLIHLSDDQIDQQGKNLANRNSLFLRNPVGSGAPTNLYGEEFQQNNTLLGQRPMVATEIIGGKIVNITNPPVFYEPNSLLSQPPLPKPTVDANGKIITIENRPDFYEANTLLAKAKEEPLQWAAPGPLLGTVDKDKNKVRLEEGLLGEMGRREKEKEALKKMGLYHSTSGTIGDQHQRNEDARLQHMTMLYQQQQEMMVGMYNQMMAMMSQFGGHLNSPTANFMNPSNFMQPPMMNSSMMHPGTGMMNPPMVPPNMYPSDSMMNAAMPNPSTMYPGNPTMSPNPSTMMNFPGMSYPGMMNPPTANYHPNHTMGPYIPNIPNQIHNPPTNHTLSMPPAAPPLLHRPVINPSSGGNSSPKSHAPLKTPSSTTIESDVASSAGIRTVLKDKWLQTERAKEMERSKERNVEWSKMLGLPPYAFSTPPTFETRSFSDGGTIKNLPLNVPRTTMEIDSGTESDDDIPIGQSKPALINGDDEDNRPIGMIVSSTHAEDDEDDNMPLSAHILKPPKTLVTKSEKSGTTSSSSSTGSDDDDDDDDASSDSESGSSESESDDEPLATKVIPNNAPFSANPLSSQIYPPSINPQQHIHQQMQQQQLLRQQQQQIIYQQQMLQQQHLQFQQQQGFNKK